MIGKAAIVTAVSLTAGLLGTAATASAAGLVAVTSCGTTISSDAYLPHDLSCAGGTGVTITQAATLDLRGHRLIGPGRGTAGFAGSVAVALATAPDAADTRIVNGTLTGWETGVQMFATGPVRTNWLTVRHGHIGLDTISGGVTLARSGLFDLDTGVNSLFGAVRFTRSVVSGSGQGINVNQTRATVEHSAVTHNDHGINCGEASCLVTDSLLRRNDFAVFLFNFGSVEMHDDVVVDNTTGVFASDAWNTHVADISTSRFVGNKTGVRIDPSAGATVQDSSFSYNGVGVFAETGNDPVFDFHAKPTVLDSVFRRNGDGVLITDPQSTSTIGGNLAYRNARWGLFVAGHVTDLGGNVAFANGQPAQCFGVTCSTGS